MGKELSDGKSTCYGNKRRISVSSDRMTEIKRMRLSVEGTLSSGNKSRSSSKSSHIVTEPQRQKPESPPTSASEDDEGGGYASDNISYSEGPLLNSTFTPPASLSQNSSNNSSLSSSRKDNRNSQDNSVVGGISDEDTEDPYLFGDEDIDVEESEERFYSRYAPKLNWDVDLRDNQLHLRFDGVECGTKDRSAALGPILRCDSAHRKDKITFKFCNSLPIRVALQYFSPISGFSKMLHKHISGTKDDNRRVDLFRQKIWGSLHHLKSPAKKSRRSVLEKIDIVPILKDLPADMEKSASVNDNLDCDDIDISHIPEPIIMRSIDCDIYNKRYVVKDPQGNGREITRFSVHAKKLRKPHVLIRDVQAEWVDMIKSDIQEESFLVEDCLPCLLCGYNGSIEDFNMSHLGLDQTEIFLETLGGNHIRVALEELMQQAESSKQPLDHPIFRDVPVSIYFNLTEEECMILARKHNQRLTHKMSWWDEIKLVRQCKKRLDQEADDKDGRYTTNGSRLEMKVKDILGTQLPTNYPVKLFYATLPEREFCNLDQLVNNSSRAFKEGQFPCREFKLVRSEKNINSLFEKILLGSSKDKSLRGLFSCVRKRKTIESLTRGITQIVPGNMQVHQIRQRWPQLFDEKEMLKHGSGMKLHDKFLPQPFIRWVKSISCPLQLDIVVPDLRTGIKINGIPLSVEIDPPDERLINQLAAINASIIQHVVAAWQAHNQATSSTTRNKTASHSRK